MLYPWSSQRKISTSDIAHGTSTRRLKNLKAFSWPELRTKISTMARDLTHSATRPLFCPLPHDAPCGVLCFAHILFLSVHGLLPPVLSQSLFTCCALWLRHSPLLVFVYLIPTHPLNYHLHKATLPDTLTWTHPSLTPLKSRCSPSEAPRCELLVISEAPWPKPVSAAFWSIPHEPTLLSVPGTQVAQGLVYGKGSRMLSLSA